jgi:hypothetical protein
MWQGFYCARRETAYWDRETVTVPMSRVAPSVSTACAMIV